MRTSATAVTEVTDRPHHLAHQGQPYEEHPTMSLSRTTLARLCLGLALLAVIGLAAGPASAQKPRNGSTPASCDVEDEHGKVSQVPEGTRVGLFYCGSDSEWHFGTVILDHPPASLAPGTSAPTGGTKGTITGVKGATQGRLVSFADFVDMPRIRALK
ncbi:MAG: hypothetical protein OEW29_05505 [Acidimicrobiia bacterium]|nr:hypothetical protein [Acidimicrobiia bacterium]MDH4365087.1 hypothetical protein [Acidimicrobiia bacterium]